LTPSREKTAQMFGGLQKKQYLCTRSVE